jgi:hypothetical protein
MLKKISKNGKVFGILAIVLAGLSFIIPVYGVILACFVGTPLVLMSLKDVINIAFLSPSLALASAASGGSGTYFFYLALAIAGPAGLHFLNKKV